MTDPESTPTTEGQAPTDEGQAPVQTPPANDDGQAPESGGETPEERVKRANREAKNLRDRAKNLEARLAEYEQRDMTDQQRLEARATAAETRAVEAERAKLRLEIGLAKGLTPEAMKFLQGSTQEELEASADELKAMIGGKAPEPAPDFGAGARPNGGGTHSDSENFSAMIRKSAGRPA